MKKIFALGDSVMKGIITDNQQQDAGVFKYRISDESFVCKCEQRLGRPIENLARFGNTIVNGLKLLDRYIDKMDMEDWVVTEFGGNDCNFNWKSVAEDPEKKHMPMVGLEAFGENYRIMIDRIKATGAKPILLTLPILESRLFFDFVSRGLNQDNIMRWLGGDVNYINNWHEQYNLEIFKIGLEMEVRVIDISTIFLKQRDLGAYYCADGMHPNELGHGLIADAIMKRIEKGEEKPHGVWGMVS